MSAKPLLKLSGALLAAGIVFGVGVRISQWLVPAPAVRISLCDDTADDGSCLLVEEEVDIPAALLPPESQPLPRPTSQSI